MDPEQFVHELKKHNLTLTEKQKEQFKIYFKNLVAANRRVNLTRITAEDEVYLKHFFDSLTPLLEFKKLFAGQLTLCDVGSGAGFPSIPLKIVCPSLKVTVVDSLAKRLKFLRALLLKLHLSDVVLVHGRAEDVGRNKNYRGCFDLVTARAVAKMSTLSEYCLPLTKEKGYFIALKGPKAQEELAASQKAIQVLGGQVMTSKELTLPQSDEKRTLILVQKIGPTPKKYPRKAGTPSRKPIH